MIANPNDRVGLVLALVSCSALGLAIAVARFAYEGGANGLAVATIRVSVAAIGLFVFCVVTGRPRWLGWRLWLHCAGLGVLLVGMTYGNVGSVEFIPVGLAALLFYTFPPMVALGDALIERRLPAFAKTAAVLVAFAGLALMLGVSFGAADPRGLVMAMTAAVSCAIHALWLGRRMGGIDVFAATFHMTAVATIALLAACVISGSARLPETPGGWLGTLGVVALQGGAMPLYFLAIQRIGALKCAVLANVQPVVSIVVAYWLFAEILRAPQIAGGALVLAGIWMMQRHDRAASRAAPPGLAQRHGEA